MCIRDRSKICSRCKNHKSASEFNKGGGADGLQGYCRDSMRDYRKRNVEEEKIDENALYVLSYDSNLSGLFKIGRTSCVEARVVQLEASHCFRIVVHAAFPQRGDLENKIHEQLAVYQATGFRGKERFNCPINLIIAVIAAHL